MKPMTVTTSVGKDFRPKLVSLSLWHTLSFSGVAMTFVLVTAAFFSKTWWGHLDIAGRILGVIAWYFVMMRIVRKEEPLIRGRSFHRTAATTFIGGFIGLLALPIYAGLASMLPGMKGLAENASAPESILIIVSILLVNGLITPFCEEVFWRGVFWDRCKSLHGTTKVLLLSSIGFALSHIFIDFSFARVPAIFALGILFGLVRYRWGLWAAYSCHALMNILATTVLCFPAIFDKIPFLGS